MPSYFVSWKSLRSHPSYANLAWTERSCALVRIMADLEAVLADVSYLMAMEKSKCTPAARASKKIVLPDPTVRCVMIKYMERNGEINFDKIFNQRLGYLLFKDFCLNIVQEQVGFKLLYIQWTTRLYGHSYLRVNLY